MFIKFLIKRYFINAYKFLAEGISMLVEGNYPPTPKLHLNHYHLSNPIY